MLLQVNGVTEITIFIVVVAYKGIKSRFELSLSVVNFLYHADRIGRLSAIPVLGFH
jgi:branched-subunit amino acid transport protein AzlD